MSIFNKIITAFSPPDKDAQKPEQILSAPDKGIHEVEGILAKLWRMILIDRGIGPLEYEQYVQRYLAKRKKSLDVNPSLRLSDRGNLQKTLFKKNITWERFLRALSLTGLLDFEITLRCRWENDKNNWTEHKLMVTNVEQHLTQRKRRKAYKVKDEQPDTDED